MNENIEKLTEIQRQILEGHLLGDGSLTRPLNNNSCSLFRVTRKTEDKNYLMWSVKHFENFIYETGVVDRDRFDTRTQKTYYCSEFHTKSLPIFTEYYNKWYPDGKKAIPKDLELTPLMLAVWLADDGTFTIEQSKYLSIKIATNSFSYKSIKSIINQLKAMFNGSFNIHQLKNKQFVISSTNQMSIYNIFQSIYYIFPLNRKIKIFNEHFNKENIIVDKNISKSFIKFATKIREKCPICYRCGSPNTKIYGFSKDKIKRKRRYYCSNCYRTFMDPKSYFFINSSLNCPFCLSNKTIKNGIRNNNQRYKCKECLKHFS